MVSRPDIQYCIFMITNELEQQPLTYEAPQMLIVTVMLHGVLQQSSDQPPIEDGGEIG